jgi:GPH family glycoside/pentoside/hexuronide:cation symporter
MSNVTNQADSSNVSLPILERFAYGSGNFANALVYGIVSTYLVYYYTNVVGLAPGIIGMIMLVSRVFDGVTDLAMGRVVDLTKSKKGKGRVWILRICIPYAVASVLLFAVPSSATTTFQYIYVFLSYNIVNSILYTALTVPYNTLGCLETSNAYERGLLGIFQMGGSFVSSIFLNATIMNLVTYFGNDGSAWTKTLLVYAIVGLIVHLCCYMGTKERVHETEEQEQEKPSFAESFKALIKNKYWVMYLFANLIVWTMVAINSGSVVYYAQYVIGDRNISGTLINAGMISQVVFLLGSFILIKKVGKGKTFLIGGTIMAVGFAFMLISPKSVTIAMIGLVIKGVGNGLAAGCMLGITADTIDYSARMYGVQATGIGNAAISFAQKVAAGLGGAVMGWVLELGGFDGTAAEQTAAANSSIMSCVIYIPLVLTIACVVIMSFYDLDKKNAEWQKAAESAQTE